jgi:ubiquinone/menaquinone biosynthesis C-methylase UbiE
MGSSNSRPLGDAPDRSYANKLERFARFIAPELKRVFHEFGLHPGTRVLDAGCGTGISTCLFADLLGQEAQVVGLDLSLPHLRAAKGTRALSLVQADAGKLCFRAGSFDLIWSCNTINHLADPVGALSAMKPALRPAGRIVLAQSGLLPEMFFAWDAPLDDAVRRACHEYYRDRYGLRPKDTAAMRGLVGQLKRAGFRVGRVQTINIERVQPLSEVDRAYFAETMFEATWGMRIKPYLSAAQWSDLRRNVDPESSAYCLDRADFHHIQTLTVCVGHA